MGPVRDVCDAARSPADVVGSLVDVVDGTVDGVADVGVDGDARAVDKASAACATVALSNCACKPLKL